MPILGDNHIKCPFCQQIVTRTTLWSHTRSKHKEEWEKWQDFHLEWHSGIKFIDYIKDERKLPLATCSPILRETMALNLEKESLGEEINGKQKQFDEINKKLADLQEYRVDE